MHDAFSHWLETMCRTMQDAMLIGADYYESEEQRKALFEAGRIPMGIGENSVISNTIVDKNARIGKNCRIINKDGIEEANREARPCSGSGGPAAAPFAGCHKTPKPAGLGWCNAL